MRDLAPSYFALVMATGIVSVAADAEGMRVVGVALSALNLVGMARSLARTALARRRPA